MLSPLAILFTLVTVSGTPLDSRGDPGVCTRGLYRDLLPLSAYAPAVSFCAAKYPPAQAATVFTTVSETKYETKYNTGESVPLPLAHTEYITTTETVTVTRGMRRRAEPVPTPTRLSPTEATRLLPAVGVPGPTAFVDSVLGVMATFDEAVHFFPIRPELDYHYLPRFGPAGMTLEKRTGRAPANGAALLAALKAYARAVVSTVCSCIQSVSAVTVTAFSPPPYVYSTLYSTRTVEITVTETVTVDPPPPACPPFQLASSCDGGITTCRSNAVCVPQAKTPAACAAACQAITTCKLSRFTDQCLIFYACC
jgi:hypothetical protein